MAEKRSGVGGQRWVEKGGLKKGVVWLRKGVGLGNSCGLRKGVVG